MARGAQQTANDMSRSGYNSAQDLNQKLQNQNQQLQNYLVPQYQTMIKNPGYDAATKNAITLNSEGAAAATYGGASDALARSAARTGNSAGVVAGEDRLAQEKAKTMSDVAAKNQVGFADASRSDVRTGLQGLSGIYGMDTNLLARSLGIPPEYLAQFNKKGPSNGILSSLIGAGGAVGAAAVGA